MIKNRNKIEFKKPKQILNMGGPWVGDLFLDEIKVNTNVIIDNVIYDKDRLFFVRYIDTSKWKNKNYFTLNIYDLASANIDTYDYEFNQIFIEKVDSNLLTYYDAFHNEDPKRKKELNLDELRFLSN